MTVRFVDNLIDHILENFTLVTLRYQTEPQRKQICRYRIVVILGGFVVEVFLIVSLFQFGSHLLIMGRIGVITGQDGKVAHHLQQAVIHGRREDFASGDAGRILGVDQLLFFRRHAPVTVTILEDQVVAHGVFLHKLHPLTHSLIVGRDTALVAKLTIQHVSYIEVGSRPGYIVTIDRPGTGRNIGDTTQRVTRVINVLQPFFVEQGIFKDEALTQGTGCTVTEPTQTFVTLRAVGRPTPIVATDTPIGIFVHLIDHRIRRFELTDRLHLVINHLTGEDMQRRHIVQPCDFDIAETVVNE